MTTFPTSPSNGDYYTTAMGVKYQYVSATTKWIIVAGIESTCPTGTIIMFGGAAAPSGWVLCNGTSYLRTGTYAPLFAVIGTTFGSVDGTHFTVPDMQGVFPKGAGTTARAAGKDGYGNYYTATLGTYDTDKMQTHRHLEWTDNSAGSKVAYVSDADDMGGSVSGKYGAPGGPTTSKQLTTGTQYKDSGSETIRSGNLTEPQSLGLTYIIKL